MEFDYKINEEILNKYILECRSKIKNQLFNNDDLEKGAAIKSDLIKQNKIDPKASVNDAIKTHRNEMIDIKLNHTMRVVKDVTRMSEKMNLNIDFEKILKVSALLHDIARFEQATWSNSFNDRECKIFNGDYHAEYGYKMLYINNKFNDFKIPNNYKFAVAQAVKFHQTPILTGNLALNFRNVNELNPNKLTGQENLNNAEKIIVSALVQMVKDVDMLDILYQHLTGEFPVVKPSIVFDINSDTLQDISKYWGISEKEILDYNNLKDSNISNLKTLNIPVENVDPKKLVIAKDIQEMFFTNKNMDLKGLQNRRDWTFITGMWWRLNHFLNNINFVSNLEVVEENELLEKIYATYPDIYKPLVRDAFTYAKEKLLRKNIERNRGEIYVGKSK